MEHSLPPGGRTSASDVENAPAKGVKFGSAVHTSLEELQRGDKAIRLALVIG
jgi:hypothetical protein